MKVLVLGSNGQLGRCIRDQLVETPHQIIFTSRKEIDISNLQATKKEIIKISPDVVINATAYTAVDQAERDQETANLINHLAISNIAETCAESNSWLIHISTDYVFDGENTEPYTENSETAPQSVYGLTKLKGELALKSSGCLYIIIRTAWVYSEYGNNFLKTMINLGAERNELSIVSDQYGCPTYAKDIANTTIEVLHHIKLQKCLPGIYHYCGDEACSWYDFALLIFYKAKMLGFKTPNTVKPIKTNAYPTIAARPFFSVLDCSKIKNIFGVNASNLNDGITKSLEHIRESS
jgi:dTDP-4-dehydrorhamnose reductase